MGGHEDWRTKFRRLLRDATIRAQPITVTPRHRISNPALAPSDWWDRPEMVLPQCNMCHDRPLPGQPPLVRGLCGPCRLRLDDETPSAA